MSARPRAGTSRRRAGPHLKPRSPPPIILIADRAPLAGAFLRRSRCRTASDDPVRTRAVQASQQQHPDPPIELRFEEETMMTTRMFLLMEQHARLDDQLRLEQRRRLPDPFKMLRLKKMKLAVKDRLHLLTLRKVEKR